MPQKKASDPSKDAAECILRIGKNNNVVQWKEEIQNELTELYGLTAMFFTTNERYVQPFPREEDYIPDFPDSDDEEEPPVLFNAEGEPLNPADIAAQAVAREAGKRQANFEASRRSFRSAEKSDGNSKSERTYGVGPHMEENVCGLAEQSERRRGF
jgi:hypothetical protein